MSRYCKVYLLPDKTKHGKKKTKTRKKTLNPEWEEILEVTFVVIFLFTFFMLFVFLCLLFYILFFSIRYRDATFVHVHCG